VPDPDDDHLGIVLLGGRDQRRSGPVVDDLDLSAPAEWDTYPPDGTCRPSPLTRCST
jgi:hypothetical protein